MGAGGWGRAPKALTALDIVQFISAVQQLALSWGGLVSLAIHATNSSKRLRGWS